MVAWYGGTPTFDGADALTSADVSSTTEATTASGGPGSTRELPVPTPPTDVTPITSASVEQLTPAESTDRYYTALINAFADAVVKRLGE